MRRNCALLLAALLALLVLPVRAAEGAELAVDSRVLTGEEETPFRYLACVRALPGA